MEIVYGVPWIEIEFGRRPEGWKIFNSKEQCIKETKEAGARGVTSSGYLGPKRPLHYKEIPKEIIPAKVLAKLADDQTASAFTQNSWTPPMASGAKYINVL